MYKVIIDCKMEMEVLRVTKWRGRGPWSYENEMERDFMKHNVFFFRKTQMKHYCFIK